MRKITLAAAILGLGLLVWCPGRATAGTSVLGWHRGGCCAVGAPVTVVPSYPVYPFPPAYYPYAAYPYPAYPYGPGPSYFRPDIPYGSNVERNWRDTWQDDG